MPYVYRYIDKEDDTVKYVGIIKKENNFPGRFINHTSDKWYIGKEWKVEYFEVPTQSDAEALESHLIAKYGTDEWYNKSKSGWGECSFAPEEFKWIEWTGGAPRKNRFLYESRGLCPQSRADHLLREIEELKDQAEVLMKHMYDNVKDIDRQKRATVREWFRETFEPVPYKYREHRNRYKLGDAYGHYYKWYYENYETMLVWHRSERFELYEFEDEATFTDALLSCTDLCEYVSCGCICGVVQAGTDAAKELLRAMDNESEGTLSTLHGGTNETH